MSDTNEPMTRDTIDASSNYGIMSVLQVLAGVVYESGSPALREHLKKQIAKAKAQPIQKWNRKEEIDAFETAFESVEVAFKTVDDSFSPKP